MIDNITYFCNITLLLINRNKSKGISNSCSMRPILRDFFSPCNYRSPFFYHKVKNHLHVWKLDTLSLPINNLPLVAIIIALIVGFCTYTPNRFSASDNLSYLSITPLVSIN